METASRQDTLFPWINTIDAHCNSDLEWGRFSFCREVVFTLKLIDKTKGTWSSRMNGWHLINSLPNLLLEVETFMENSYYTSKIDRWQEFSNLLRLSKFSSGLHLQTTVKFSHFNKFQHCCDLCVLVCTLKSPIKNDEFDSRFSLWGPFCEPTFTQMWKQIL